MGQAFIETVWHQLPLPSREALTRAIAYILSMIEDRNGESSTVSEAPESPGREACDDRGKHGRCNGKRPPCLYKEGVIKDNIFCYKTFFLKCLVSPSIYSVVFTEMFNEVSGHLLSLSDRCPFDRERGSIYFFSAVSFLYTESGTRSFKNKFIRLLSLFFVREEKEAPRYLRLCNYSMFKGILALARSDDFRIREFMCNTGFLETFFGFPEEDLMITMLKWKFLYMVTVDQIKLDVACLVRNEGVKAFIARKGGAEIGSIRPMVEEAIKKSRGKDIEPLFR